MVNLDHLAETSVARRLTLDDFGGFTRLAEAFPSMAGHPVLVSAVEVLAESVFAGEAVVDTQVANALDAALTATQAPAIYRDAADRILGSPALLPSIGPLLAASSLEQGHLPEGEATSPATVLRAADALEVAVQLRLANWAPRWDLFAYIESFKDHPESGLGGAYPLVVLRVVVACVEQWREAADLVPVARILAGIDAPSQGQVHSPDEVLSDSDAGLALARISTLAALRAEKRDDALKHLDDAHTFLAAGLQEDDRPDSAIAADIATLLRNLIGAGTLGDPAVVARLCENVREQTHLDPGRSHWVRDRVAASQAAWALLSRQLADALEKFAEPSWYDAASVVDAIVGFYRTASSNRAFVRSEDDLALEAIIAPVLEDGFASKASLLHHLDAHVSWLQGVADSDHASEDQLADLAAARTLRESAIEKFAELAEPPPKDQAGAGPDSARPTSAGNSPSAVRVGSAVERRRQGAGFTLGNLVADQLLETARAGFSASPDYRGDVQDAVDLVSELLIRFLWDRNQIGEKEAPYLYTDNVKEDELASDLHQFLRGSGSLGSITTEVRHVGGGRVDIKFGFPGFSLYVELKVDGTKIPVPERSAYLRQAASYTAGDQRIGYLIVLKLLPERTVAPHLSDCLEVVEVADSEGNLRHVAAFTLAGARTKPSDM
jgi:hypothetical protein